MHKGFTNKFINGPINKKNFFKKKFPGITEYISYKFKKKKLECLFITKNYQYVL